MPCFHSGRNCRRALCCSLVWMTVFLLSFDISAAMWSPLRRPEGTKADSIHVPCDSLRGGSSMLQPPPPEPAPKSPQSQDHHRQYHHISETHHTERQPVFPKITLRQAVKALLHTSELNRRLLQGVKHWGRNRNQVLGEHPNANDGVRDAKNFGYGDLPVNVHPSRTWQPPIKPSSGRLFEEEDLSLFHAKKPRSLSASSDDEETRGVSHWGPDLLPYMEHIVDLVGIEKNGVEIILAMIYMDRACSVETRRGNGVPSCPFCSPRTVHRLSLAALLVSIEAVRGQHEMNEHDYFTRLSQSLGISMLQLQQMVDWMRAALGDDGVSVTLDEMNRWSRTWESIFPSSMQ